MVHTGGWVLKNWCLRIVVLKTLESHLDYKQIKPINPKGNQPSILFRELLLKLKLQYFDYLMWRADSLENILMPGNIEDQRRRGMQRIRWLDGIPDWLNGHEFEQTARDSGGQRSLEVYHGVAKSQIWLSDWTITVVWICLLKICKGVCQGFIYFHPDYLTFMQSTSWETLGWKKHKLESRLLGEI